MTPESVPKTAIIVSAVVAAALATFGWAVGLTWANAVATAVALVTIYGLRRVPSVNVEEAWRRRSDEQTDRGARREVARLSWSLRGYEERVELGTVLRLRRVAAARLASRGLSLERPADADDCRRLLGPATFSLLTDLEARRPRFADFTAAVGTVERLEQPEPR